MTDRRASVRSLCGQWAFGTKPKGTREKQTTQQRTVFVASGGI